LLFNFDARGGVFVLFQAPHIDSGIDYWCIGAVAANCAPGENDAEGYESISVTTNNLKEGEGLDETGVIGTAGAAATPEPSYFAVGAGIIALIGFRKLRVRQQQSCESRRF
jgi:hypothetical protein